MKIFLALKSMENSFGSKILGVYDSLEEAKNRCLREPSFCREGWLETESPHHWHNGGGLIVLVQEETLYQNNLC